MPESARVVACLTAFNRREKTCAALGAFFEQEGGFGLSAVLMDDGSRDGTTEAVSASFPKTEILRGDGSLFWNGGMAAAFEVARRQSPDFYLWLNDDTMLRQNALRRLVDDYRTLDSSAGAIVVGSTLDGDSGSHTYGGVRKASVWHPGRFVLVEPSQSLQACDAMNGNIVLVSAQAAERVGAIDDSFTHSMGDYDYALRARAAGLPVVVGRGYHGACPRNSPGSAWHEKATVGQRYRAAISAKGLPVREWTYFLRKHGGLLWPIAWLATYRRILTG
jgi:GT2 family glycosyltransferase